MKKVSKLKSIIQQKLFEIEKKEDVKIIHAIESGSRAWGFPSPDSDYDVRFIYVRPEEFYLSLQKTKDVIEWQLDDTLDINGWDIQKALRLLYKSNPTLFEWCNSPIVYHTTPYFTSLKQTINNYFSCKSALYHYLSTAQSNYRDYFKGDTVRLKKYFYVIRPILACKWILENQTPPPMQFSELVSTQMEAGMHYIIKDLLLLKMQTPEMGEGKPIDKLNKYIEYNIPLLKTTVGNLPNDSNVSWHELNNLFLLFLKMQ